MKLFWKTTLTSGVLVLVAFGVTAAALMTVLPRVMDEEIDEQLLRECERTVRRLEQRQPAGDAVLRISPRDGDFVPENEFRDVMLQPEGGDEPEPFRQLSATRAVRDSVYDITLRASRLESEDLADALLTAFLLAAGLLIAAVVVLQSIAARRLWKPFYEDLATLGRFTVRSDRQYAWSTSSTREFQQLSDALDDLTRRVRNEYATLKHFTENASHELQTPLSVLRATLDRLRQHIPGNGEASAAVDSMDAAVDRLSRLNRNLLLLTRLENRQYDIGPTADVGALVDAQLDDAAELFEAAGLRLERDVEHGVFLPVNTHLFDIMLGNLLSNTLRYSSAGGTVRVGMRRDGLYVQNPGEDPGMPADTLFERFRRAGTREEASGLGLSIVREIATFHGWAAEYDYGDGVHTLIVRFPL